ncbi:MAG TPA: hypothetical protein VJ546_09805, partial [Bacillales bacterium]|nr:hypothetical protein [Bacillales bacterium]
MIKTYSNKILDQIKENYIVGVLASKDDYLPRLGDDDEPVTYSDAMNDVLFYVKPLSQEPKEITEVESRITMSNVYVGLSGRSFSNLPLEFKYIKDMNKRIKFIRDKLEGKLLLFKPVLTYQEKNERFYKNIDDVIVEEDWKVGTTYYAVPRINLAPLEFESKLLAEEAIHLHQYNHAMPAPLYVVCGDYIYGNIKENQWRMDPSINSNARVIISPSSVKRVEITEEEKHKFTGSERELLVFFNDEFINTTIADRLDNFGIRIGELKKESQEIQQNETEENYQTIQEQHNEQSESRSKRLDEIAFIRDLEIKAKARNLVYSRDDLINFHTSIKSSALTILSGQSGIGKTKLATIYGETLGLSQE